MTTTEPTAGTARRKIHRPGSREDIQVPFTEVTLSDSPGPDGPVANDPVLLYDTSGPGAEPTSGLPRLRERWIVERGDTEVGQGRAVRLRDDGRAASRSGEAPPMMDAPTPDPRRARPGRTVTQMHYARAGVVTPEMEFVAV
ncbi:MAG: phosphomethylpyrimidine synthase ThiC, partial [Actinomycetota bacterium]